MAWYNSFKDLTGDIGSIASNPAVDIGLSTGGGRGPGGRCGCAATPGDGCGGDRGSHRDASGQ